MKKNLIIALLAGIAVVVFAKTQTACPVMGGKINKALYTDVKGCRIYVCCAGCIETIKADPDKFIKKMKADGVEPEQTPKNTDGTSGATKKWKKRVPQ